MWSSFPILPIHPKVNDSCLPELEISLGASGNFPVEMEDLLFPELEGLSQELGDTAKLVPELCKEKILIPSPKLQSRFCKPAATSTSTAPNKTKSQLRHLHHTRPRRVKRYWN